MSLNNKIYILAVGASLVLSACTSRAPQSVQIETPKANGANPDQDNNETGGASVGAITVSEDGTADVPVLLDEEQLKNKYNLDTKALKYKFTYLTTQEGDIVFAGGKASLTFKNLPTGQTAQLKFEVFENGVIRLAATQENFTLNKGAANRIDLVLQDVGNSGGATPGADSTDLTIDVTAPNGGGNAPPTTPSTPPTPSPSPSPAPPTPSPSPTPPADPIAEWDGKSFKGNAKWNIVPVEG